MGPFMLNLYYASWFKNYLFIKRVIKVDTSRSKLIYTQFKPIKIVLDSYQHIILNFVTPTWSWDSKKPKLQQGVWIFGFSSFVAKCSKTRKKKKGKKMYKS